MCLHLNKKIWVALSLEEERIDLHPQHLQAECQGVPEQDT